MRCGISIDKIDEMKYVEGKYYLSYKKTTDDSFMVSPHLDKRWNSEMSDIGQINIPKTIVKRSSVKSDNKVTQNNNYVFISYSSQEDNIAKKTKMVLEDNGISCWMAPQAIPPGSDYGAEIPKAISNCSAFLLLLSNASQESKWVPKEVGIAISKGKIVIPFQIDDSAINDTFNFMLTNNQRIAAYDRFSEAYKELIERMRDFI